MANSQCDRLIDYFNDDLDEQEARAFEEHLEKCAECREELEELKALTEDLPYASEPVDPPDGMKERILTNVFADESPDTRHEESKPEEPTPLPVRRAQKTTRKLNWWIPMLAAALLLSLIGNAYSLFNENRNQGNAGGTEVAQAIEHVQLKDLSKTRNTQASATMMKTDTGGVRVVLQAKDLKKLKGSKVYQVWLIDGKTPYRAGTFIPNHNGEGAVSYRVNLPKFHTWDKIAISVEPSKNSKTPKGPIILAGTL
ncbi:MAG TPA: anti-sigma factor [Bacillales bacterium]|nr:anti-sigma factor [Bacillales bacterium]